MMWVCHRLHCHFTSVDTIHIFFYRKTTSYEITKGEHFSLEIEKAEVDLTPEMLQR